MPEMYIEICGWDKFQHYKKRNPPWVKLYAQILDDDDFDCLPDDSKLLFFCLLPFAARRDNKIKLDFRWLQKKLPITTTITKETLQPLINAGFIACYQGDSVVLSSSTQDATPETETETETETERYSQTSDELRRATFLLSEIQKRKPDFKKPNLQKWAAHVDRMIHLDKRSPERIKAVIQWCQQDAPKEDSGFGWQDNILSTAKLRQQFDKLELAMQRESKSNVVPLDKGLDGLTPRDRALAEMEK